MMSNFFIPSEYKTFLKINMLKADKEHGRIKKREKRGPLGGRPWHVLAQDNLASAPFIEALRRDRLSLEDHQGSSLEVGREV